MQPEKRKNKRLQEIRGKFSFIGSAPRPSSHRGATSSEGSRRERESGRPGTEGLLISHFIDREDFAGIGIDFRSDSPFPDREPGNNAILTPLEEVKMQVV